jgi:hypothetical protein
VKQVCWVNLSSLLPGCLCINHIEVSPSPEITNAVKLVQLYVNILINTPGCLCINPIDVRLTSIWFIQRHPGVLIKMLNFGIASALGQVSSYLPEIFH